MRKIIFVLLIVFTGIVAMSFYTVKELPTIGNNAELKDLPAVSNVAFNRGEKLTFELHYGFIDAGKATLAVTDEALEFGGRKTFHVVGLGSTMGVSDWFFKVRDRYESYIDEKALVPWMFIRRINEGGFKCNQDYIFNHYNGKVKTGDNKTFDVTPNIQDMVSAFYQARNLDLSEAKTGSIYSIDCFVDDKVFPVKIKFIGRENVTTGLGTFKCLKFRPIIQTGRIFKHEEDLNVWISDDRNHLPVKGQADILIGSIKVELTGYSQLANPLAKVN